MKTKPTFEELQTAFEDVLAKANSPDDLAKRIAAAERGVFDDPTQGEPAA